MVLGLDTRPTRDVVVLLLAVTLCATLVLAGAGLLLLDLTQPDADLSGPWGAFGHVLVALLGLVAGYAAGRGGGHGPTE